MDENAPDPLDPRGLIRESYRMEGVGEAECRSIFLDWAISTPFGPDGQGPAIRALLLRHSGHPGHPMSRVLRDGLDAPARTGRRGGWRARRR